MLVVLLLLLAGVGSGVLSPPSPTPYTSSRVSSCSTALPLTSPLTHWPLPPTPCTPNMPIAPTMPPTPYWLPHHALPHAPTHHYAGVLHTHKIYIVPKVPLCIMDTGRSIMDTISRYNFQSAVNINPLEPTVVTLVVVSNTQFQVQYSSGFNGLMCIN